MMLEKLRKFLESQLCDHQGFLKDVKGRLIDKTHVSDPTKRELLDENALYLHGINIESDY